MSRITKQTMSLECVLTDAEKLKYGKEISDQFNGRLAAENNLKMASSQFKATIEGHNAKISEISQKLSSGKEFRNIECDVEYDFKQKEKRFIRMDTGEIAKVEIITHSELQEELRLESKRNADKPVSNPEDVPE